MPIIESTFTRYGITMITVFLLSSCSPEWQCYLQKKMAIDAIYRPRIFQQRALVINQQISPQTFQSRVNAIETEWNNRLEYEQQKCFGTLPSKRKSSTKSKTKASSAPAPTPAQSSDLIKPNNHDSIRLESYKKDAEEVKQEATESDFR